MITLDSGETQRAVIPEAILVPSHKTNTYLLAHTPLLMAGHEYICSLEKPRLKFDDGGEYTMSVKRGHQIIKLLSIEADKETTHTRLYLHLSQPYDPPTFINNTLFNAANRPDAKTPLAFHFHLRMGCASEAVLRHTQHTPCVWDASTARVMEETQSPLTLQRMPCWQDEESQQDYSKGLHGH